MIGEISSGIVVLFMLSLALLLTKSYILKKKIYTLWWSLSFWLAFIAASTDFTSYLIEGWTPFQYKTYLFSAASLVAYMGAGTVFLFSKKFGTVYVILMSLVAFSMIYTLYFTPINNITVMPPGEEAQGFVPDNIGIYFALLSGIGAVALFLGAIYSWIRTKQAFNLWIALGALIFSMGGMVGKYLDIYIMFYVFQAIGSVVLYYGIVSSFSRSSRQANVEI